MKILLFPVIASALDRSSHFSKVELALQDLDGAGFADIHRKYKREAGNEASDQSRDLGLLMTLRDHLKPFLKGADVDYDKLSFLWHAYDAVIEPYESDRRFQVVFPLGMRERLSQMRAVAQESIEITKQLEFMTARSHPKEVFVKMLTHFETLVTALPRDLQGTLFWSTFVESRDVATLRALASIN